MTAIIELKPYQRVVAAAGLSNLADGIRYVALPLLVLELTTSPLILSAVVSSTLAPWLLFGLWAGGLADRVDRKLLAQRTALARVALLSTLGVLILMGTAPIALLLVAAFVLGLSEVVADSVNGTLIPSLVPDQDLERANSRMVGAEILGNEMIGPAIGGLLFAAAASLPFFTNAGLLALAFLLLSGLPLLRPLDPQAPTQEVTTPRTRDGIAAVRSSPLLRAITWSSALLAAIDGAWFALLALLVIDQLGMAAASLGILLAIGAVGGLLGAALADRASGLSLPVVSGGAFIAMAIPLLALSLSPTPFLVAVALAMTSGAFSMWNVFMVSARQRATAPELLGRVGAAYRTVVVAAALTGTLAGGLLAELFSVQATLAAAAIALCLAMPAVLSGFRSHTTATSPDTP